MNRRKFMNAACVLLIGPVNTNTVRAKMYPGLTWEVSSKINIDSSRVVTLEGALCEMPCDLFNNFPDVHEIVVYPKRAYVLASRLMTDEQRGQFIRVWSSANAHRLHFAIGCFRDHLLIRVEQIEKKARFAEWANKIKEIA